MTAEAGIGLSQGRSRPEALAGQASTSVVSLDELSLAIGSLRRTAVDVRVL